jgi:hypothetical protein
MYKDTWKLGTIVNIIVITMVYWNLTTKSSVILEKVFGPDSFSFRLLLVMWSTIALLSLYILIFDSKKIVNGLYTFQILYKIIAWLILDLKADNPITRTNLVIIPLLLFSLYEAN